jgi:hypothetical protein
MFSHISRRSTVTLAVTALGILVIAPAPAFGEAATRHCVARADPSVDTAPTMQCYSNFEAAMNAATGDGPLTSVVLSIDYTGTNETGNSLTWTQSSGCGSYSASSMPAGWNDVVSSVSNFNGCGTSLYQNTNFGGSKVSVAVNATAHTLGSFNGQASSQKWCTSNVC